MRFARLPNLVKRTFVAFFPQFSLADDAFARSWLDAETFDLYRAMDVRDRQHACEVARALLEHHPDASRALVGAALLHDVGKSEVPYRALERIFVHLYTPKDLPAEPRLKGLRGAWQRNLHHDRYGAALILEKNGCVRIAEIVARHHHPDGDAEAELLSQVDERF